MKETRVSHEELDGYGTTTSALTFLIRKFKPTSNYPHQKSLHFLAHIMQVHGQRAMFMMMWLWQQTVYCRGQRHLNLLGNHQWFLLMISHGFLSRLNEITYTKKRILSSKARKVTTPLLQNKHIQMEMVILALLFGTILMPLVTLMSGETIANEQDHVLQVITDIKKKVEGKDNHGVIFGICCGFSNLSSLLHDGLTLDIKLFADVDHKSDTDTLLTSRQQFTITFKYASEQETTNHTLIYIQVIHLLHRFLNQLSITNNTQFKHESNTNYSVNVQTQSSTVTLLFSTNNEQTIASLQYDNIKIILSSLTEDLHFFVLWDSFYIDTQIVDENEPLWTVSETYDMVKRMVVIVATSIYLYPNYENVSQRTKTELIVMKHGLFRGIQSHFKQYDDRHWVHAQRRHETEDDEKMAEDEEDNEQQAEQRKHINYHNVGQEIDFYFHVNGIQHYIFTKMSYSQLYWLCVIVKFCAYSLSVEQ